MQKQNSSECWTEYSVNHSCMALPRLHISLKNWPPARRQRSHRDSHHQGCKAHCARGLSLFITSGRFTITSLTSGPCSPSHPCFLLRSPQPLLPLPLQLIAPCLTYFNVFSPPEMLNVEKEDYLPTKQKSSVYQSGRWLLESSHDVGIELPFYTSGIWLFDEFKHFFWWICLWNKTVMIFWHYQF